MNDYPNLYAILGLSINVCKEPNCNELIKRAYIKKARDCHPDKNPGSKVAEELFELLTGAFDILKDEKQRNQYNQKFSMTRESSNDFFGLRKQSSDHYSSIPEMKEPKVQVSLNNEKISDSALTKGESKRKLIDMEKNRAKQDVDLQHAKLFDGTRMDNKKFNTAFDRVHKKEDDSIVLHNGVPLAWDNLGTIANFSEFDDLNNLYVESNNRMDIGKQNYASINFGNVPTVTLTKEDVSTMSDASYYDRHNDLDDDYYQDMKKRLHTYDQERGQLHSIKDFKKDTAGYGIFDQLGLDYNDRLSLEDDNNLTSRYNQLMAERTKN